MANDPLMHYGRVVASSPSRSRALIRVANGHYTVVAILDRWIPHHDERVTGALETRGPAVLTLDDGWLTEVLVEEVDCDLSGGASLVVRR